MTHKPLDDLRPKPYLTFGQSLMAPEKLQINRISKSLAVGTCFRSRM